MAKSSDKNFLICPISAQIVLALTLAGAKENTAVELSKAIRVPKDVEQIQGIINPVIKSIHNVTKVKLSTANKMFVRDKFPINETYKELAIKVFDAEVDSLDFTDVNKAANIINEWVESKTENKIKKLIDSSVIDSTTALLVVNALHFKGTWEYPFETFLTRKAPFHLKPNVTVEVDTMSSVNTYLYAENAKLDAKFLQIPYQKEEVVMVVILPNKIDGLKLIENELDEVLSPQKYEEQTVQIDMPKFEMEYELDLIPHLKTVSIKYKYFFN